MKEKLELIHREDVPFSKEDHTAVEQKKSGKKEMKHHGNAASASRPCQAPDETDTGAPKEDHGEIV
jgi:hypothetical protein